jgi:uncharacterized protein YcnI
VRGVVALATGIVALVLAAPAAAHIEVVPPVVQQGTALEITFRVPAEREVATTRVRVDFPPQVTVFSLSEPPNGWAVRPIFRGDQRMRGAVWSGGRIAPGRYADFQVLGTPFEAGTVAWPVRQTYADGQVKPWTGAPGQAAETGPTEPGPAPTTQIVTPNAGVAAPGGDDDDSGAAIWLGVIAIAISALSAFGVGMLWSTRPARLPDDEAGGS